MKLNEIIKKLQTDGYVKIEGFLKPPKINELQSLFKEDQKLNSNEISYIYNYDAKFLSNALALSKPAFNIATSIKVRKIASKYLGNKIRLKCHRIYTSSKYNYFPWHTDTKYYSDKKNINIKSRIKGIVFIIYIVDTNDGATEFVTGSHKFSDQFSGNTFTNDFIQKRWSNLCVKMTGKAGDVIISDTKTIHRGSFGGANRGQRISFWFQIDQNLNNAERLLINPSFLPKKISSDLASFLGFGLPGNLSVQPKSDKPMHRITPLKIRLKLLFNGFIGLIFYPIDQLKIIISLDLKKKIRKILLIKDDWEG
jgi:hypothetical protein